MINTVLNDRYQILEQIGRGGMAYVYKAKDLKLNRFVAVKVLREEYTENAQFIKKFDRESQAAAGLSHPNIVSVYDVGVQDNIYYIIMEYVDGITLKQYLNKKGHLDYSEATQFIIEIAAALKCAHNHKIIHRDIKPHNILLTRDLTPKVADFGIARAITSSTVTITNQTMGSVHYISPEQARGGFVDERSDLYSLGIMYYELLTGELPFDEESSVSIAIKHIQEPLNPPKNINPEIPDSLNNVVVRLTEKKPEDRYQNMDELIDDLDILLDDFSADLSVKTSPIDNNLDGLFTIEPVTGPIDEIDDTDSLTGISDNLSKNKKRRKRNWIIFGVIALLLLAAGGIYASNTVFNKNVVVPDLSNKTVDEATITLQQLKLGIEVEKQSYNADVEKGKIISQTPGYGTQLKEGKTIKVIVSLGTKTATVPDVVGMSEEKANSTLTRAGFVVDIQREYNSSYDYGVVFDTDPGSGKDVTEGDTVVIYVSKGEDTVTVPGLIGLTQTDASNRLLGNGLSIGTITQESSSQYAAGVVMAQSPPEGAAVEKGTYVDFVVSTGAPTPSNNTNTDNNTDNKTTDPNTDNTNNNSQNSSNSSNSSNGSNTSNTSGSAANSATKN